MNYWDKLFSLVQSRATHLKDERTNRICRKLVSVPANVKYEALKKYVSKCQELYSIAFL